jgi:hypothetical protein
MIVSALNALALGGMLNENLISAFGHGYCLACCFVEQPNEHVKVILLPVTRCKVCLKYRIFQITVIQELIAQSLTKVFNNCFLFSNAQTCASNFKGDNWLSLTFVVIYRLTRGFTNATSAYMIPIPSFLCDCHLLDCFGATEVSKNDPALLQDISGFLIRPTNFALFCHGLPWTHFDSEYSLA